MKVTPEQMKTLNNTETLGRTEKYTAVKTLSVVNIFKEQGFTVDSFKEQRVRKEEKLHKMKQKNLSNILKM